MRNEKDDSTTGAPQPLTAEQIINEFIKEADMAFFEEHLHEMFLSFVRENQFTDQFLEKTVYTYQTLRNLIKRTETLQNERKQL